MSSIDGMTREELAATYSGQEMLDRLLVQLMFELDIRSPEKLLPERLGHSKSLQEYRQEILRRLPPDGPPKTEVANWADLQSGAEFLDGNDRWMKFVDDRNVAGSILLENTCLEPRGKVRYGHYFTYVKKIIK